MQPQTAVVLGATGLIGTQTVELLLNDPEFKEVRILVRKPMELKHPKLTQLLVDFSNESDFSAKIGKGDCLFCAVGTTQQKVKGDKQAYRKVDYDIPVNAARHALKNRFHTYLLVSSVGANSSSKNFYLQLKGEVEDTVAPLAFSSVHIFQPSMLLGNRKEFRLGELIGKGVMKATSFLFAGSLEKYKAIQATDVAKAMVYAAKQNDTGVKTYQFKEIMSISKAYYK